jgi:hypothetical protein
MTSLSCAPPPPITCRLCVCTCVCVCVCVCVLIRFVALKTNKTNEQTTPKNNRYTASDWSGDKRHCLLSDLQTTVTSMATMEAVIRHNDYKKDKCSQRDSCGGAVACRADLELGAQMFGALDAKWSSYSAVVKGGLAITAELGPTHDQQSVFCWSKHPATSAPHHGHPDCYDFEPTTIMPNSAVPVPQP